MSKFTPSSVLLIPDLHVGPGDKLDRLDKMRTWVWDQPVLPSAIVQIGDLFDFESLCTHDMQTADWSKRSLQRDIDAGRRALDRLDALALDLGVPLHFLGGNHEARYDKWMQSDNRLASSDFPKTVGELIDGRFENVEYREFGDPLMLNGAAFVHYFVGGLMNRPVGGDRPAATLLRTQHFSTIQGHKHTADWAEHTRPDGTKIFALVCGCFVDPKKKFSYAGQARKLWWNGFHMLHFYKPGEFDLESISLDRLNQW